MLRRFFLMSVALLAMATAAQAGSMYVYLAIDPATTAGAGIAPVGGMSVSSSKSGAGTFQLYAVDDTDGSFGLKSYQVKLNGTLLTFLNRAPNGAWNDTDGAGPYAEAMNDVRTASIVTNTTSGGQNPTNPFFVKGMGISASNLVLSNTGAAPGFDPTSTTQSSSGAWGLYSPTLGTATAGVVSATGHTRNAILLAEGNYSGTAPTVDLQTAGGTALNFFTSQSGSGAASAAAIAATNPFGPIIPEPATLTLVGLAVVGFGGLVGRRR